jgi:hypothetical protein
MGKQQEARATVCFFFKKEKALQNHEAAKPYLDYIK